MRSVVEPKCLSPKSSGRKWSDTLRAGSPAGVVGSTLAVPPPLASRPRPQCDGIRPTRMMPTGTWNSTQAREIFTESPGVPPRKCWFDASVANSGADDRPLLSPHSTSSSASTCIWNLAIFSYDRVGISRMRLVMYEVRRMSGMTISSPVGA